MKRRAKCGITKPSQPIVPLKQTDEAVSNVAQTTIKPRSNRILAPINLASRSPNESTLIRQRIRNKPRVVSKMIGERISKLS